MKNKKWISLAAAVVLAVTALPMGVFAAKKDGEEEKLTKITLNEVAHSIFYAPQYVAIEEGYFAEEGLDLTLVTGFGADKVLTALISGEADIGFMGAEASIYAYQEGATDPAVNFAQLTQRAGNFLVAREEMPDFKWEDLKGKKVLGGRKGGMPEMVFEYILRKNGLDPQKDLTIDQSIDFGSTAAAFTGDASADFTVEFEPSATALEKEGAGYVVASLGVDSGYVPTLPTVQRPVTCKKIQKSSRNSQMLSRKAWNMSRLTPRKKSRKSLHHSLQKLTSTQLRLS